MANTPTPPDDDGPSLGDPPGSKIAPGGFISDLSMAARAIANQPTVALVTVALWSFPALSNTNPSGHPRANFLLFVWYIALVAFLCGWAGAERIFFLGQFEGKPVSLRHLVSLVSDFTGRFVTLGLVVAAAFIPYGIVLALVFRGTLKSHATPFTLVTTMFAVAMDLVLTFVPAALAFTTPSVRRAIRIGLAMIRQTWPRSALYVLCPVLALNMNRLVFASDLPALRLMMAAGLAIVSLLAKGATVAFYLRERPAYSEDGAAHLQNE